MHPSWSERQRRKRRPEVREFEETRNFITMKPKSYARGPLRARGQSCLANMDSVNMDTSIYRQTCPGRTG